MVRGLPLLLLLGCQHEAGSHYVLQVTPTAQAIDFADTLAVTLRRTDRAEHRDFGFTLRAGIARPWTLDVQTGPWGAAPIEVAVEAQQNGRALARGSGAPAGDLIAVTLSDVEVPGDGFAVDDLSPPVDQLQPVEDLASPDLATAPDLGCSVQASIQAPLLADTVILGMQPTLNFGAGTVGNLTPSFQSEGLFKFDVSALPGGKTIKAMRLKLSYAKNSSACSSACGSCDTLEKPGQLSLFYLRSDWLENEATWNVIATGINWGDPGAQLANVDRSSATIATANHLALADVTFNIDGAASVAVSAWRSVNQLSFQVVPSNGVELIFSTREWDFCPAASPAPTAPRLEIDYCN